LKIAKFFPQKTRSNHDIVEMHPDYSVEKISKKIGISNRYIAGKDEFASDLGSNAAKNLFIKYNIDRSEIDFLILVTQSPDYLLPATSSIIHANIGLSNKAGNIDVNQGCSGYLYGLSLAKGLLKGGISKNVLLITADTYTKYISNEDKSNKTIFGDAATASLITIKDANNIGEFIFGTDGKGVKDLYVKGGALRNTGLKPEIFMNGPNVFNFTIRVVPELIKNVLDNNNISIDEIDYYIFHQANMFMLNHLRKKINIPKNKFIIDMESSGNTVSSTIPIVLENSEINFSGKTILLAGFGVGLSWSAVVIRNYGL